MLSKNKLKYIRSLKDKKYRSKYGVFIAEGNKMVSELLTTMKCQLLAATREFLIAADTSTAEEVIEITESELSQISFLKNPQQAFGIFYQPANDDQVNISGQLILALDGIQDPGNMGTIVRLADWYGIKHIFCSPDTADIYNPKVVQATMGAIARVNIHYIDLGSFLNANKDIPVYGTLLSGMNIYDQEITPNGIIVMGNEGNGIRPDIEKYINRRLLIPNYPPDRKTSESLNVAIATAIVCAEFRRRSM